MSVYDPLWKVMPEIMPPFLTVNEEANLDLCRWAVIYWLALNGHSLAFSRDDGWVISPISDNWQFEDSIVGDHLQIDAALVAAALAVAEGKNK